MAVNDFYKKRKWQIIGVLLLLKIIIFFPTFSQTSFSLVTNYVDTQSALDCDAACWNAKDGYSDCYAIAGKDTNLGKVAIVCDNTPNDIVSPANTLSGLIKIYLNQQSVKPNTDLNIKGEFIAQADGVYYIEAGPDYNQLKTAGLLSTYSLTAIQSACDGNTMYAGKFTTSLKKGDKVNLDFNVKTPSKEGLYSYDISVYNKCAKDGGSLVIKSSMTNINVTSSAALTLSSKDGVKAGSTETALKSVDNAFEKIQAWYLGLSQFMKTVLIILLALLIIVLVFFR